MKRYPLPVAAILLLLGAVHAAIATADVAPPPVPEAGARPYLFSEQSPPPGRLPELARPQSYRLDLTLDPRRDDFSGTVDIDLELLRDSDVIWLHGKDIEVQSAQASGSGGRVARARYEQLLDSGVAALRFEQPLGAGPWTVRLHYRARFDRNLAGLFKVEEQGEAYVLAKSESIQARRFLPGFDEPGLKASFDLSLTVPAGYQAIANAPELSRQPAGEGMERLRFATTPPMPTYLLSLAVGPFDVVERPPLAANAWRKREVPLRGFARKGRGADMNYILDITPEMMAVFEGELQKPYPFAKLDIVAAPQWPSGATELSAAITYREQRILVGDDPAPGARLALVNVHAHEIAHMWFGNLVTPPWWDDLWLKEGFATWGTPLALTLMEPEGGHGINAAARAIGAMRLDSLASTRAIREPILSNDNVRNAYDAITYSKSLGVIHMVDQYFGAEVFRPALGRYVARFAGGEADAAAFYEAIGEETDTPALAQTFRSFVEQKGVPLLEAQPDCDEQGAVVTLSQQRYRPLGSPIPVAGGRWTIPVCLATAGGERHCQLLQEPRERWRLPGKDCPAWVLPNAGGSGYYRWQVPAAQWRALLAAFDDLEAVEQLSLVDSVFALFEAGELAPEFLWATVRAAAGSSTRQVVAAPLKTLGAYLRAHYSGDDAVRVQQALRDWYRPALARVAASEDADDRLLHSQLLGFLATDAADESARAELARRAAAFTGFGGDPDSGALDSDVFEAALTVAVQDLGDDFVRHLIDFRAGFDDPRFEGASASALGRATSPGAVKTVQAYLTDEALGPREKLALLHSAMATPAVRAAHWQWVVANFAQLAELIPAQSRRHTPRLGGEFCSQAGLDGLQQLFARQGERVPGYRRAFDQTVERIGLCMALAPRMPALLAAL